MDNFKILIADDDELIRWSIEKELTRENYDIVTVKNGKDAVRRYSEEHIDILVLDYMMPAMNGLEALSEIKKINKNAMVIMLTAANDAETAVKALKSGAHDYIVKPYAIDNLFLSIKSALNLLSLQQQQQRQLSYNDKYHNSNKDGIIYSSEKMAEVMKLVTKVIATETTTVLLQGESGTGKNLIAKTIHDGSDRNNQPYIEINCGCLPDNLLESELFGHEKGSFTDAKAQKIGLFEHADRGTVFLDEIGEMKMDLQTKLLRVIEEKKFRRIGGTKDIHVDVRIIAATNKNLFTAVEQGEFRADLFYRLNVITITIPPLRERKEDIMPLAAHFLDIYNRKFNMSVNEINADARELLLSYNWPGNIRELKNVLERGVLFSNGSCIDISMLTKPQSSKTEKADNMPFLKLLEAGISLEEVEGNLLGQALAITGGNQSQAAKVLKIGRDSLRRKMKRYGFLSDDRMLCDDSLTPPTEKFLNTAFDLSRKNN